MMRDDIKNFAKQFAWQPEIQNQQKLKTHSQFVVAGMGGSHLAADLMARLYPQLAVRIHANYGLPSEPHQVLQKSLVIASSYSGNTEETLDVCLTALKKKVPVAVIATGGKLLTLAKRKKLPYIQLPDGMQPRAATGLSLVAMLKMMGESKKITEARTSARLLKPISYELPGRVLAKKLRGAVPVLYASTQNSALAYRWKIAFNETGKIPAFHNVFPELNHNEVSGFDASRSIRALSKQFYFIFLQDAEDHPRIQKRMKLLTKLYRDRGLRVETIPLRGTKPFGKLFSSILLADWTALHIAKHLGIDPDVTPLITEFKERMAK